jgi:Zn-dependent protease
MLDLSPPSFLSSLFTLVIAFTIHEFAHAWTAVQLGDDTPLRSGRLTLNPLAHIDILGGLMFVVAGFGWAKPVPFNPVAVLRRTPAGVLLVAAAGPVSNLLLAVAAALPLRAGLVPLFAPDGLFLPSPSSLLNRFIILNLVLFFLNMIPIFPLDGEKIAEQLLGSPGRETLYRIRPYGPLILLGLIFLGPRLGLDLLRWLVSAPSATLYRLLVT